jgi:hypothetical protein
MPLVPMIGRKLSVSSMTRVPRILEGKVTPPQATISTPPLLESRDGIGSETHAPAISSLLARSKGDGEERDHSRGEVGGGPNSPQNPMIELIPIS